MKIVLEMISPGLCGGAIATEQAEIRPSSVRGMLRWWFRVLGGFKALEAEGMGVREQEDLIFGVVRGNNCMAGKLQLRIRVINKPRQEVVHAEDPRCNFSRESGYFLFPLRKTSKKDNSCAMFLSPLPQFELHLRWFGEPKYQEDIAALGYIYGYLGSLGMRSRRAMGALAFAEQQQEIPNFHNVMAKFSSPENIGLYELKLFHNEEPISALARWLRSWRAYSFGGERVNSNGPGFDFAENDHDVGYNLSGSGEETFRPALGLPIIQHLRRGTQVRGQRYQRCEWEYPGNDNNTRFASPIILRPYRDFKKNMKAIVIFVDKYSWPEGQQVKLNYPGRRPQPSQTVFKHVNTELYEKMKKDKNLYTFNPN